MKQKAYRLEPIINLATGRTIGHELLAGATACPTWTDQEWRRWYDFLSQEIPELSSRMDGLIFVNLSGRQLLDSHISRSIRALREIAPRIVIEWVEQHFHEEQFIDVLVKLNFLKGLGFVVAIDDIGASVGVDGLGRAGAIKAGFCKIDGSYFQNLRGQGPDALRGLFQHLSHGGSRIIVEWIETEEDKHVATAAGAHFGQGFLWGKNRG